MLKRYISIILIIFLLFSCKNNVTEPTEFSIVGKWQITGIANKWIVRTNSDQTLKVPYSGNGEITSLGSYSSLFNGLVLINNNPLTIAAVELDYGIVVTDAIVIDGNTGFSRVSNSNTDQAFEGNINYIFDGITLTIIESTLINPQNAAETVVVKGSLSFKTISIPQNTVTKVQAPDIWMRYYYTGSSQIQFYENNSMTRTIWNGESWVEETGRWNLEDDILTLTVDDTIETYPIHSDERTIYLTGTKSVCDDDLESSCLSDYEVLFGIDENSLTELGVEITAVFNPNN